MLKRKITGAGASLSLAVGLALGAGMMGVSTPANAVSIAHDNLGEVLVFPYYTVNEGWATYFNITNTSADTVVAKVRWREGHNSREVRDFNIALSPHDVWTAAVVPHGDGARIVTTDKSCTMPALPSVGDGLTGKEFSSVLFNGAGTSAADASSSATSRLYDGGPKTDDRQREGYFEVISMGRVPSDNTDTELAKFAAGVLHGSSSGGNAAVPDDCSVAISFAQRVQGAADALDTLLSEPMNVLKGRAVLIRPSGGEAMGYDPLVLANYYSPTILSTGSSDGDGAVGQNRYFPPGGLDPNLEDIDPKLASWVDDSTGLVVERGEDALVPVAFSANGTNGGADAISALLLRSNVYNDYNIANSSATQMILTMPTKNYYVDYNLNDDANKLGPFSEKFYEESCVPINVRAYDREEYTTGSTLDFSPSVAGAGTQLCNEVNLLTFGEGNLFGETPLLNRITDLPADNGWVNISFPDTNYGAIPVIGFRAEVRDSGKSALNYGFANEHAYKAYVSN